MDDLIVRHGVAPDGVQCPIDNLVVGPAGVFAVGEPRLPRAVMREQVEWMRAALDARGLAAMPAIACHGLAHALTAATADRRFSAATVQRAAAALEPLPAFVADLAPVPVSDAADTRTPNRSARPSTRTSA
jgi:hypothetical protein